MSLLQQSGLNESSSQPTIMGSANFAGSSSSLPVCLNGSSNVRMLTNVAGRIWIVDSGATDHMTSNKTLLFNITPLPVPYLVSLPNGYKVKVTCTGALNLLPSLTLHHVLYIPTFHHNLISLSKLIAQFKCYVFFTFHSCILLQAHSMKKLLELGRMDHGVYKFYFNQSTSAAQSISDNFDNSAPISHNVMDNNKQFIPVSVASDSPVSTFNSIAKVNYFPLNANVDVLDSLNNHVSLPTCNSHPHINKNDVLWHHRLGHVPFAQMKNIPSISSSLSAKQSFICLVCPLARQPRLSFPNSSSHSTALF